MVIPIGALRGGEFDLVRDDIARVVEAIAPAHVKVILETAYLTGDQILRGSALVSEAGAAFVKTSTGFAPSGATPENVALLRQGAAPETQVKAAGGMNTLADCIRGYRGRCRPDRHLQDTSHPRGVRLLS